MRRPRVLPCALAAPFLVLVLACGDPAEPSGVEATNRTDDFSFRIADIADYSGTFRYVWENTGARATIRIDPALASGIGTIQITDGVGATLFTGSALEAGTTTTEAGAAGRWAVNIILVRVAGSLDLSVRKAN